MSIHWWGDKDFDWKGLDGAIRIIYFWTHNFGRLGGQLKEKFGGVRFYVFFSDGTIHSLVKVGHYYYRWSKWVRWVDYNIIANIMKYGGLLYLLHKWQRFIYRFAYKRAVARYPHLRDEILVDADLQELVEGINGYKSSEHWTTYTSE